jgi:hypothetical protein
VAVLAALAGLAVGCAADFEAELGVVVADIVPTVVTVRWEVDDPSADELYVEFGRTTSSEQRAPAEIGDDGVAEAILVGLKPDRKYRLRAAEVVGGSARRSQVETVQTGPAPVALPDIEAWSAPLADHAGGFVVTTIASSPSYAVIVDDDGDYVWWHQPDADWDQVFIPRAIRSRTGPSMVYLAATTWTGGGEAETGWLLLRVALDGTEIDRYEVFGAHHDLVELSDGTLAAIRLDTRMVDGEAVEGDRIVEIAPDGTLTDVWSIWDHETYDPGIIYAEDGTGWSHANALDVDEDEDTYTLSARNLDTLYRIDRGSGDVLWRLGGAGSDFAGVADPPFQRQHQFDVLGDTILVFDNGLPEDYASRVVEYALDEAAGEAELTWSHRADPDLFSIGFGDAQRLPSGNTLVTWSTPGRIDEVTPGGDVVWSLEEDLGAGFGYATWASSLY